MPNGPFLPPSLEDVTSYAKKLGYSSFNAERFLKHHADRGWLLKGRLMQSWRAAVVTWQRNSPRFQAPDVNHSGVFSHPPGWEPRDEATLNQEGINVALLKQLRENDK